MQADPAVKTILTYNDQETFEGEKILDEYNEQALELMHGLGIDIERTKKVKILCIFSVWGTQVPPKMHGIATRGTGIPASRDGTVVDRETRQE